MSTTGRYAKIKKADVTVETGYLKAWVTPVDDFTTIQNPSLSSTPVIGEKFTVGSSHVWATGKEAIPCYIRKEELEAPGESVGETRSLKTKWKPKLFFVGDGAKHEEVISNLMNEELIIHIQQGCDTEASYIQFGCDCNPAICDKRTFSSGQLLSGKKGSEVEFASICKYFYTGTITARTV